MEEPFPKRIIMRSESSCWCGNRILEPFSTDYLRCAACETLVLANMPPSEALLVRDDEHDLYGKHYFERLAELHNQPSLETRSRADLPERCIYWLSALLRYRQPPARVLELGSSHGGFVALMRWAGFDATGLDLSPSIVAESRQRFDVPILEGPIESQEVAPNSLDAVVLMDVLEHLADPKATLQCCLGLLKPDGLFFIQTPHYCEGKSFPQMVRENDLFLQQLKSEQHLYLFSESSVKLLFQTLGLDDVTFVPAIFSFYDMALFASRNLSAPIPESDALSSLKTNPSGRLVLALHDLSQRFQDLTNRFKESETDRALRLDSIFKLEKLLADQSAGIPERVGTIPTASCGPNAGCDDPADELGQPETLLGTCPVEIRLLTAAILARDDQLLIQSKRLCDMEARCSALLLQLRERQAQVDTHAIEVRQLSTALAERDEQLLTQLNRFRELDLRLEAHRQTHAAGIESATAQLMRAQHMLSRLRQSYVFRLMRKLTLWSWLDVPTLTQPVPAALPPREKGRLRTIAVDLTPVLPGGGNGGAKVMTLELIRHLASLAVDSNFVLLTSEQSHEELASLDRPNVRRLCVNQPGAALNKSDNMALRLRSWMAHFLPPNLLLKLGGAYKQATALLPNRNTLIRELDADLLFCPFTAPFFFDSAVPTVCVVYDLQHAYYPQFFDAAEIQERARNLSRAVRLASGIVCISEYVRKTLLENTSAPPDRVETIHILLPNRLPKPSASDCERILKAFHLRPEDYLLYPANFWPHKNHELLLTAFRIHLASKPRSSLKLVLTGSPGPRQIFLRNAAQRMGISHAVIFPGYLSDDDFSPLLQSCMAVIFPSLFEGFGMPLLEAMATGRPLLCSNSTSLTEVAGDAALVFDPRLPTAIADAISRIESDSKLRQELAVKGTQRLAAFGGPEEMAARYLEVFRKAVQEPAETLAGVYGVFADGWLGERCTLAFGSGGNLRTIRMVLALPEWVPTRVLSIHVELVGSPPKAYTLMRGEVADIQTPADSTPGSIYVSCSPSFQPHRCGFGDDSRTLTCLLQLAEVVAANGVHGSLDNLEHGS